MIYGIILILVSLVMTFLNVTEKNYKIIVATGILGIILLFSPFMIFIRNDYKRIPVKLIDGKITQVEESNYHLGYKKELNFLTFIGHTNRYTLSYMGDLVIDATSDQNKIINYLNKGIDDNSFWLELDDLK